MKIIPITGNQKVYSSNVYMLMGEWKRIEDMNTLVDVGNDPSLIDVLENLNAGVGKKKVDQVVLTHDHSDHSGILPLIRKAYHPRVYAFSPYLEGVDHVLKDGDILHMGDKDFEVMHTPGHSSDSICLYNSEHGDLFVGDTPVTIISPNGAYEESFYHALLRICRKDIRTIYFGHGAPLTQNAREMLQLSLNNVRLSLRRSRMTEDG